MWGGVQWKVGKIGKRNWLHKCPRADLKMTGRLSYLAGRAGVPRDLDLEEIATKLLSRVHHSFLYSVSGRGTKATRCWMRRAPRVTQNAPRLRCVLVPTFPGGEQQRLLLISTSKAPFLPFPLPALLRHQEGWSVQAPLISVCLLGIIVPC